MLRRVKSWFSRNGLGLTLFGLILLLVFAWLTPTIFIFIPPGHVGVYWVRFGAGTVTDRVLSEGVAYKLPWDRIYIYNARLQISNANFTALTSGGLHVAIDLSTRYRLIRDKIPSLHKNVGPNYVQTLLLPEVSSDSRQVIANYTAEQLYSLNRTQIEESVLGTLREEIAVKVEPDVHLVDFVFVEDVLLRNIELPDRVRSAIQDKQVQFHIMQGYAFRIEREEKERVRKQVEAKGIRDFQHIVSEGISEQYLKWKGINATLELATSNNAKVVVIGAGEGGLPIILGNIDPPSTARSDDRDAAEKQKSEELEMSEDLEGASSQALDGGEAFLPFSEIGALESPEALLLPPAEDQKSVEVYPR